MEYCPAWLVLVVPLQAGAPVVMLASVSPATMPVMLPVSPIGESPALIILLLALYSSAATVMSPVAVAVLAIL